MVAGPLSGEGTDGVLDDFATHVLGRAGEIATARGERAVQPDDVIDALCIEHPDLLTVAMPPSVGVRATAFPAGPGSASLMADPRTRRLLTEAADVARGRPGTAEIGPADLLLGALFEASRQPPPGEDAADGMVALAQRIDLGAVASRLRAYARDSALDNPTMAHVEYEDPPRVLPAAVRRAASVGSRRVEPPHVLQALHSDGAYLVQVVVENLRLDLEALPPRTGPDSDYERGATGDRPSMSLGVVRALDRAATLEARWTGQRPVQGSLLAALFATWEPARALLTDAGVTQEELERLILAQRDSRVLGDAALVRTLAGRGWRGTALEPLVDRMTLLARRCVFVAPNIARALKESAVTPFHVGLAAVHLAGEYDSSSLRVALAALGIDPEAVAGVSDREVPHEVTTDGLLRTPLPWTAETTAMIRELPALTTRLRRGAVDTCALFLAACRYDEDLRTSLEFLGGTQDLLVSAAVTETSEVRGPDADVRPPRTTTPRRPVLEEPGPELAGGARERKRRSRTLDLMFRGESMDGQFANTDLQQGRLLRWRIANMAETALALLRLAGTVAAASAGGWWLILTMAGSGAKPSRLPIWALLALEAVAVVLLPAWMAVVIAASLVVRGVETWWSLQWRRAATGDPTYDLRRMRRDTWYSGAGGWRSALIRRQDAAEDWRQEAAGAPA